MCHSFKDQKKGYDKKKKGRRFKIQSAWKAERAPEKSRRTTLTPQKTSTRFSHGTKSWWFGRSF